MQNIFVPAGPAAARLAHLGWVVFGVFSLVTICMWALVFWAARRRPGTLLSHLPWNAPEDKRWLWIGGLAVPIVTFSSFFVMSQRAMSAFPMGGHDMPGEPAAIRVTGHQWWWEVEYLDPQTHERVVTANEIHIPVGQTIEIELQSRDVIHSFWVPRLHGKVDLLPGKLTRIRVQADAPSMLSGQCAEYCGPQHAHMGIVVIAQPAAAYEAWLAAMRMPATGPRTVVAEEGAHLFQTRGCALCHSIRGTLAGGLAGPDLTHVGARFRIAANTLPNTPEMLAVWVSHAQAVKPYAQMPTMTVFTDSELRAVVEYLQSLK